jgi:hypothetical protein
MCVFVRLVLVVVGCLVSGVSEEQVGETGELER